LGDKTGAGLAEHCEKALREKWLYLWGTYGQRATQALIDANIRQYPDNERWRAYAGKAIGTTRVSDCYGMVKSYIWWQGDGADPKYCAAQDVNTQTAFARAREKGTVAALPEVPGAVLYMTGHVGVYVGGGRFIECAGGGAGVREGKIAGGKVVAGSGFTHWFLDAGIEYADADTAVNVTGADGPSADEVAEAIRALAAMGIISSPEYWAENYGKVEYLNRLIVNMGEYCRDK